MEEIAEPSNSKKISHDEDYEIILNSISEGVLILNRKGQLLKANSLALKIHGLKENTSFPVSRTLLKHYELYNTNNQKIPFGEWPVIRLFDEGKIEEKEYLVLNKTTGQKAHVSYRGIPIKDEKGKIQRGIFLVRDISEIKKTQNELASRLSEQKSFFKTIENYQELLKNESELLKTIINTIPVMVTVYDKKINTIILNYAFEKITGWTKKDAKENNIMELVYPEKAYRDKILRYMRSLKPGFKDILMRTKNGRDIETSWANISIPDGRQVGVGIDISERKQMEKDLIEARKKAEEENYAQYAFIQNISHEVRTPMNSILGFTEILQNRIQGEKEQEFLDAISYNGQQLLRLIDDIIDFSRLDKHEMTISEEEISITELMEHTRKQMSGLQKKYGKRHIEMVLETPVLHQHDVVLQTDNYRLQQVLTNLISNAIKYTHEGKIEVGYQIHEQKKEVLFYVKDTGIGIRKNDHDRIFKRFTRLKQSGGSQSNGTGLGLSIAQELVKLLDGKIWFKSEPGKGTTMYFTHPYLKKSPAQEKNTANTMAKPQELPNLNNRTILIAEDDAFSFMMMEEMLKKTNATILHAPDGERAIELFENHNVDLIFLDIRLPGKSGFEIIAQIRKQNKNIPVIAQTANALPEDKKRIMESGFHYHATKPISWEKLNHILMQFT